MTDSNSQTASQTALFDAPAQPAPIHAPRPLTHEDFKPGDRVRFSDGTPRPPERFNNKLKLWKRKNWTGTVISTEPADEWCDRGRITCSNDYYPSCSAIVMRFTQHITDEVTLIDRVQS